ncbi:hypothetical protein G9A89_015459 [Geosiphon pyriformis]|nr:hypothetical protein G9A89_015459 [Geosiphon pyriformis]
MSRDCFRALLFTLLMGTTVHNLGTLLEGAGEKTCVINCSLETGNQICCAVIGFKSENKLESAFCTEPIFGGVRLSWARLDLVWCEKCEKFGHSVLECDAFDALVSASSKKSFKKNASDVSCLQLAKLYAKKNENENNHSENLESEETKSEQKETTENKKEMTTAYIVKIPEFIGKDNDTSPQEWLNKVQKAGDANDWNAARMLKTIPYFLQGTAKE